MARVTNEEVLSVMDTSLTDVSIQIDIANNLVNETFASSSLSDTTLKYIELYLAAHFVCVMDPQRKSEKIGEATDQFNVPELGKAFNSTIYGQQALALDTTGLLAARGKRKANLIAIDLGL
jgi:hypothetical protein